jgi:hypothetical protein
MEKVKLPKSIAEKIEFLRHRVIDQKFLFHKVFEEPSENVIANFEDLPIDYQKVIDKKITELYEFVYEHPELYYTALINGYEIEMTREERLLEVYKSYEKGSLEAVHPIGKERYHLVCQGIKIALDELGIKIKGINTQ